LAATDSNSAAWVTTFIALKPAPASVTVDKVSGTDAGFVGVGDSDPFTSGQTVTYTVQSALTPATYYWRVRGIDPLGSNTYGAWSSVRSFTITSAAAGPAVMNFSGINFWGININFGL